MIPQVALVRGPFLNPYDMAAYGRFQRLRPVAIGARRCFTESSAVGLPVRRVVCPVTELSVRHGKALDYVPWFFGHSCSLLGLGRALEGAAIVNTAETYFGFSDQAATEAARLRVPLVVVVKETIPDVERLHPLRRHGLETGHKRRVRAQAAVFIAVSRAAAVALEQEGVEPARIVVVPPAVDTAAFHPGARVAGPGPRLLFVGPALWRKGVFEAVRALVVLRRHAPATLTIVKGGADLAEALRIATQAGVRDHIEVLPSVPHREMPAVYARSDVLLAPSIPTRTWQEQDSLAVLEAMAAGVPVVATAGGIRRELLGEDARWAPVGDFAGLAERVLELLESPAAAQRQAALLRARAVAHHDLSVVAAQLEAAHTSVLA